MARNEEGEFELTLGNRQLVSVFLVVVVLLGVFFSMGYIVGRNSPATASADTAAKPGNPIVVDNPSQPTSAKPAAVEPGSERPPVAGKPSPLSAAEPSSAAQKAPRKIEERPPAPAPSTAEPAAGETFLQVVATSRADSQMVAEMLARKGFRTTVAPGPNPSLFRVLVGPLNGAADIAETRVRLESSGFKNPYVRKY